MILGLFGCSPVKKGEGLSVEIGLQEILPLERSGLGQSLHPTIEAQHGCSEISGCVFVRRERYKQLEEHTVAYFCRIEVAPVLSFYEICEKTPPQVQARAHLTYGFAGNGGSPFHRGLIPVGLDLMQASLLARIKCRLPRSYRFQCEEQVPDRQFWGLRVHGSNRPEELLGHQVGFKFFQVRGQQIELVFERCGGVRRTHRERP